MIKGILFDYGGTIDTNGFHWAEVIWEHYQKYRLPVSRELFLDAYRFGERALAVNNVVKPDYGFQEVMTLKIRYQFEWLQHNGTRLAAAHIDSIAEDCTYFAEYAIQQATPVLEALAGQLPMAIVSNFYGNIATVLRDFGIFGFFQSVIESAVVGVRKPDPQIYRLGVAALGLSPGECVVVGDSFSKDIVPAAIVGCHTIWLKGEAFSGDSAPAQPHQPDLIIYDLLDLKPAISDLDKVLNLASQ
ncbi:hypothetical protein GCM10023091_30940 [Ravibacter arvi]|uniref:HAD family hydrolase n=1 Tax=Ravibacter arvi TaxID=2051041 RepID=A0ABP8M4X7_9BACT